MEAPKFKTKTKYIVELKYGFNCKKLLKCSFVEITEKCVKIKWEDGSTEWAYKTSFEAEFPAEPKYKIIEELK